MTPAEELVIHLINLAAAARFIVMNRPWPSCKQTKEDKIAALKRHTRDFTDQRRTNDDTGLTYLESTEDYKYNTLAVGRMVVQ
jgi:hypothetical protein